MARQLGDIRRNPPRLVFGDRFSRAPLIGARHSRGSAYCLAALVQRWQAETSHLFEDNIGLTATVVRLIGIMAIENGTAV